LSVLDMIAECHMNTRALVRALEEQEAIVRRYKSPRMY